MGRVAVFVDAGYLFAQGSAALRGSKLHRQFMRLDVPAVITEITAAADTMAPGCSLLRIYWYDGAPSFAGPSLDQLALADSNNVKLRLGLINSFGQQKGVDSLIVTDLIELSRNQAISDAVVIAGDEDLRIGVVIAQQFGVRLHLLGITPARGSQSPHLMREADTRSEWSAEVIGKFLSVLPEIDKPNKRTSTQSPMSEALSTGSIQIADIHEIVDEFIATLGANEITGLKNALQKNSVIPSDVDRKLLKTVANKLNRTVEDGERAAMRARFLTNIKNSSV